MSTFVKKVTSAIAGLAIVSSIVSPLAGVSAAYTSLEAANELATLGVIVDNSANPADYELGNSLKRREGVKVMMNLSDIAVVDNCDGDFADLSASDWACKYAETALDNGMVAGNTNFRPDDLVSMIEGLKMIFQAREIEREDNADWRAGYVNTAVEMGIATPFTNYDDAVTRGQMFIWAVEAIDAEDDTAVEDDLLCGILGTCDDDTTTDDGSDDTPTTPVTGGDLSVSLSPSTPAGATIPGGVNGLAAVAYDFTAGSSDVTVSQISVKRTGLSDKNTLESLAVFTAEGRVSNAKSDNQDNDTTAQINLDNGGVTIMAGQTKTLVVVVDVASVTDAANDEFALEIVDVVANGNVSGLGAKGNTMKVGSVDAPLLTFTTGGSVSDPNLGEVAADIFEFEIENDSDEDVEVESITFEGSSDAEDDLMNFELLMGNDVVATTTSMVGDYLTFDLGGLVIEEDRTEDFTVRADVVDGAGDKISFNIDEKLDITANSTKFAFGASVDISAVTGSNNFGEIEIQAGELTFVEIDAENDEIREDKDNVVLGGLKITNVSGQQLEMETFGVEIKVDNGGTAALTGNTGGTLSVLQLFDDVELYNEETGSSYELRPGTATGVVSSTDSNATGDDTSVIYSDNSVDVFLPEGTTTWSIRADTAEDIDNFSDVSIDLEIDVANDVVVVETADDEEVDDKTPSILSFNTIDGSESGAQVSLIPLSDTDVVRGANGVVALQFEVEAEEVSEIIVDEITVQITGTGAAPATNQQISEVKLYEGSVSDANLLDRESGSDIGSGGDVTFDRMPDVTIAANAETEFVVTISFVDGVDAVNGSDYTVSVTAISIDDDENDEVDVSASLPLASARQITVNEAGVIQTVALDDANEDNEFDKLALAGESSVIASFDVRADNEEVDVETATFTIAGFSGALSLRDTVVSATLLLDGVAVETNSNSDITDTSIVFEDLDTLIIPETTTELALQLNTANIGEDFTGENLTGLQVTQLVLSDAEGVESGKDLAADGNSGPVLSRTMDIVAAVVTPSVVSTLGTDDQTAELRLVVDGGANTSSTGDAVQAELTSLDIEVTSLTASGTITVFNGNGAQVGTATVSAAGTIPVAIDNTAVVTPAGDSIGNDNEVYRIEATAEASYRLATDGVTYTINGASPTSTKLENTLELGQYAESN